MFSYSVKRPVHVKLTKNFFSFGCLSISSYPFTLLHLESNLLAEVALPQLSRTVRAGQIRATKDPATVLNPQDRNTVLFSNKRHEMYCKGYHYATAGFFLQDRSLFLLTIAEKILNMFTQKNLLSRKHWLSNAIFFS